MSNSLEERIKKIMENAQKKEEKKIELESWETDELKQKNIDAIVSANPIDLLTEYFGDVKYKQGKYVFRRRSEDASPSCYMKCGNNGWFFKDFGGDGKAGTILNLLREKSSMSEKELIQVCLQKLHLTDYLQEAQDLIDLQNLYVKEQLKVEDYTKRKADKLAELMKKADEDAEISRENNKVFEREGKSLSRITYASKQIPRKFIDLLLKRGINERSLGFYYIKGENFKENEHGVLIKSSNIEGVGVVCSKESNLSELNEVIKTIEEKGFYSFNESLKEGVKFGGDVHIIPFVDSYGNKHKTRSFGVGGITVISSNPLNTKIAVFESKMDYHAMDNLFKFSKNGYDIIIANTVSNMDKVAKYINQKNYEEIFNINQFDFSALNFNINLMVETNTNKFKYIEYKDEEYKKDANDLIQDGVDIFKRVKVGTILDFKHQIDLTRTKVTQEYELNTLKLLEKKLDIFKANENVQKPLKENINKSSEIKIEVQKEEINLSTINEDDNLIAPKRIKIDKRR